jgi:Family of unknown function (DUF6152)
MTRRAFLLLTVLAVATIAPVSAHHSFAMFEMAKEVTYKGTVTKWAWQNPHVHIEVLIKAGKDVDPATVGTWDAEAASINIMSKQGWNRATYKAGDQITLVGHPLRDGGKGFSVFYAVRPDGSKLFSDIARPKVSDKSDK